MTRIPPPPIEHPRHMQCNVCDQNPLTFNRPPVTVLPASEGVATALLRMAALIYAALDRACVAAYNAAAPRLRCRCTAKQ